MIGGTKLELRNMYSIHKRLSLLFVLLYLHLKSGHSLLITFPRDTEVLFNHSTYFNCSTSILSEQIHWYHNRVGENQTNYVYYKGQFNQIYAERYSIEINNKTGEYNLIIRSVKPGDAGQYVCQDDVGLGHSSPAELIVLEFTPECLSSMKPDGFVGPNSCDLPLDKLQLSCSVLYIGNTPPILQWKMDGNDDPILEGIVTDYSRKRATLNLTTNSEVEMDDKSFTCSTTRSQDKQLSCSTDPAKINYAVGQPKILNIAKGENTTCSANASVPCTYKWFYDNNTQNPVSYNQVLTTGRLGNHSCEANCPINGINCTFVAMRIIVDETSTGHTKRADEAEETVNLNIDKGDNNVIQTQIKEEKITPNASREMGRAIVGVAALGHLIYVVSYRSSEVETFDIGTYELKDRYNLVELENPFDLTSCMLNKCLYVMDLRSPNTELYVIRVDSNVKYLDQWSTGYEYGNLSVADDGTVIVTSCENRKLVIYSPDGNVVSLPVDLVHPSHALKLRSGEFLICHGIGKDKIHRVCILNKNGAITRCSSEIMDEPSYLAVDDNGWVFVADQGNNRVIELNSDLELIREVASEQNGLRGPQSVFLHGKKPTRKLFVVELESKLRDGKLIIFTHDLSSQ